MFTQIFYFYFFMATNPNNIRRTINAIETDSLIGKVYPQDRGAAYIKAYFQKRFNAWSDELLAGLYDAIIAGTPHNFWYAAKVLRNYEDEKLRLVGDTDALLSADDDFREFLRNARKAVDFWLDYRAVTMGEETFTTLLSVRLKYEDADGKTKASGSGTRVDAMLHFQDLLLTLREITGVEYPEHISEADGRIFVQSRKAIVDYFGRMTDGHLRRDADRDNGNFVKSCANIVAYLYSHRPELAPEAPDAKEWIAAQLLELFGLRNCGLSAKTLSLSRDMVVRSRRRPRTAK